MSRTEHPQERRCVVLSLTATGSQHFVQAREAAVYSGYDRFHTSELTFGVGEQGERMDSWVYSRARKRLWSIGSADAGSALKRLLVRYGGPGRDLWQGRHRTRRSMG